MFISLRNSCLRFRKISTLDFIDVKFVRTENTEVSNREVHKAYFQKQKTPAFAEVFVDFKFLNILVRGKARGREVYALRYPTDQATQSTDHGPKDSEILPVVVGECFVCISHFVNVFSLFDRVSTLVVSIN